MAVKGWTRRLRTACGLSDSIDRLHLTKASRLDQLIRRAKEGCLKPEGYRTLDAVRRCDHVELRDDEVGRLIAELVFVIWHGKRDGDLRNARSGCCLCRQAYPARCDKLGDFL